MYKLLIAICLTALFTCLPVLPARAGTSGAYVGSDADGLTYLHFHQDGDRLVGAMTMVAVDAQAPGGYIIGNFKVIGHINGEAITISPDGRSKVVFYGEYSYGAVTLHFNSPDGHVATRALHRATGDQGNDAIFEYTAKHALAAKGWKQLNNDDWIHQ